MTGLRWVAVVAGLPLFALRHRRCLLVTIRNPDLFAHYCADHKRVRAANLRLVPLVIDTLGSIAGLAVFGVLALTS